MVEGTCLGTETLVAFVDGDPSTELRTRVTEHAASCSECRALLSMLAAGSRPAQPRGDAAPAQVGRYLIERELGAGGMGVVYAAHDPELGRTIAIKLLHGERGPEMLKRLRREAQVMAQLVHPNVVRVYDVGTSDGQLFIAMELVVGDTLGHWELAQHPMREVIARYCEAGRGLVAAHAAGIVHRDFKPDNVLLGADGARVADFGLARSAGAPLAPAAFDRAAALAEVSPVAPTVAASPDATRAFAGTPYYMAPEVYAGGDADARSDQFSFAVALYTALFRQRPFEGNDFAELAENVRAGRIRPMPANAAPRRIRAALRRALAVDPAERFPSMAGLLAELEPPRRRIAVAAGIACAGALIAAGLVIAMGDRRDVCGGSDELLSRAWGPVRHANVGLALTATNLAYAAPTRRELEHTLDGYAADWRAMRIGACEATRVHATQSEDVLALRMSCLDHALAALDQLTGQLARRDPIAAAHAVAAARALPAIASCADIPALTSPVRPPNAALAARVTELRGELARLQAQRDLGHYREPLPAARALEPQVAALGYRPLEAELAALLGRLERDAGQFASARARYDRAVLAGNAGRDDRLVARALIDLADVEGHDLGKLGDADGALVRARAQLERLDHPSELEVALRVTASRIAIDSGKLDDGARALQEAIDLVERTRGATDLAIVEPLRVLAKLELQRDHSDRAHALLDRALAVQEGVLGPEHPEVADTIDAIAGAEYMAGNYDRATELYHRAIAIDRATYGDDSLVVVEATATLGLVQQWQGQSELALAAFRHAAEVTARELGPDHPTAMSWAYSVGSALEDVGKHDEALAVLTDLLARQRRVLGVHQQTAMTLQMIGFIELWRERYLEARDHAREALAMMKQTLGASYTGTDELTTIAGAELGLDDPSDAITDLEAVVAHAQPEMDGSLRAWIDAELGRALIDANRDRARGMRLLQTAYPVIAGDPRTTQNKAELDAWLKKRGLTIRASR